MLLLVEWLQSISKEASSTSVENVFEMVMPLTPDDLVVQAIISGD
jgi:hypothetical protein